MVKANLSAILAFPLCLIRNQPLFVKILKKKVYQLSVICTSCQYCLISEIHRYSSWKAAETPFEQTAELAVLHLLMKGVNLQPGLLKGSKIHASCY